MTFDEFFQSATGVAPYTYQRTFALSDQLPDLLEAPTGSGKTATAVLGWLWRRRHGSAAQRSEVGRRLVFCLPMRTLVEQTYRAASTWVSRLGIGDELGVHLLLGGAVDETWEDEPEREAILIGTQDQLLSRALMRGYGMSRYRWPMHFAALNNDCLWVMDEVQLMGPGASTAAQLQAFREHWSSAGSVKTVWMTATLAEGMLRTIDMRRPFQRLPFAGVETALTRRLRAAKSLTKAKSSTGKKGALGPLAGEIARAHEPGTLTLVVVNRVARAQELHALLSKLTGVDALALVHSRFRPADRRRIQEEALSGSFKGILVATQAIEAGVDISAKTLFTELAPWASLVQRFGRLNRAGEYDKASVVWIDLNTDDADALKPYEASELIRAREKLTTLDDVSPSSLSAVKSEAEEPTLPVIRKKDLLELFDTEPDLSGHDIDVSRYIRATDDRDVQVAWRAVGKAPPDAKAPDLRRDELCSVPVHEFEKLARGQAVWRYECLRGRWTKVDRVTPGMTVLLDVSVGGYDDNLGFTQNKSDVPTPLESGGKPPEHDEADDLTFDSGGYVTLRVHAEDTEQQMRALLDALASIVAPLASAEELSEAARWHDAGKVHPVFQAMLVAKLASDDAHRSGGPWAKSDRSASGRSSRPFFRHELASALAWLAAGKSDLGAFLIAAHHGKIRQSLRARPGEESPADDRAKRFAHGIHDGDVLPAADLGVGVTVPEQTLSLDCMELGGTGEAPSWAARMARVLQRLGPFRLAYLEMLVRVADWRASRLRAAAGVPNG